MASTRRTSGTRPTYICPPSDHPPAACSSTRDDDALFEFDEADVWTNSVVARLPSVEIIHSKGLTMPGAWASRIPPRRADVSSDLKPPAAAAAAAASSLPINIPDWSKMDAKRDRGDGGGRAESDEEGEEDRDSRVPPHEYLTRRRGASLSVHEGIGRTLKGRDLRRVRDAIWKSSGFAD